MCIDALATLAFDYPPRASYFRKELTEFLLLAREEDFDPLSIRGSYAGAMGALQFMPSSYRKFAVSEQHAPHRDLWGDWGDIFASTANYLHQSGWQYGAPVLAEAQLPAEQGLVPPEHMALNDTLGGLRARGLTVASELPDDTPALLLAAPQQDAMRLSRRLPEFLCHHALQHQPAVRDGGVRSGAGDRAADRSGGGALSAAERTPRRARRRALPVTLLLLAGCAHAPPHPTPAHPPAAAPAPTTVLPRNAPDVYQVPDAVPRDEPRSAFGNPPFYEVAGHRYVVLPSANGYVERGVASWYGTEFHGLRTSTGEPYDMFAMTAAHKTLPLPCYARVTNLSNGRSVVRAHQRSRPVCRQPHHRPVVFRGRAARHDSQRHRPSSRSRC